MIDGSYGNGAYKVNTTYTGAFANEQCKGFAKKVHMILFGYNIGSTKAKPNNYQISISTSKTRLVGSLTSLSSRSDADLQALLTQGAARRLPSGPPQPRGQPLHDRAERQFLRHHGL